MANPDCPECNQVVDLAMRKMLERGAFNSDSARRDEEMRQVRARVMQCESVGCVVHRGVEQDATSLAS